MKMLLGALLLMSTTSLSALVDQVQIGDNDDLDDFVLDIAPHRVPRQVKNILTKETRPHIQELSINTTILSRYSFTAVRCIMLNRHAATAEGLFRFHVPAGAFVTNFTMIVGGHVYQSRVVPRERRKGKQAGDKAQKSGDAR